MNKITLQNYRCFREKQSARLAPLTFLVGENSTGKTSFLALLRALWQVAFQDRIPDFRQPPYDLGAFEDIAHHRGARNARPDSFEAGFEYGASSTTDFGMSYHVTFADRGGYPFPTTRNFSSGEMWLEVNNIEDGKGLARFGSCQNQYEHTSQSYPNLADNGMLFPLGIALMYVYDDTRQEAHDKLGKAEHTYLTRKKDTIDKLRESLRVLSYRRFHPVGQGFPPFASAPVRSRPKRTYDPSRPAQDPEGEYIPDFLASMSRSNPERWKHLKSDLEDFGRDSGLFDEIAILSFGKTAGSPFQVQIRKFGKRLKGPKRNLIDVGYGVSQALPILTELLREDSPRMFLLQQPEVHLHPRAQAALGSLFCKLASSGKQIIVETHSDYILDRARMDIRDGNTDLKPADVSILYFERDELDVNIHSIRMDGDGNFWDAPPGYRRFFGDETRRFIGL